MKLDGSCRCGGIRFSLNAEHPHLMVDSKASWVEIRKAKHDKMFGEYPDESVAEWHQRLGLNSKR